MAWEKVARSNRGGAYRWSQWKLFPAIATGRNGITINGKALQTFGFKRGSAVFVMVDEERRMIGIKSPEPGDDTTGAFIIRSTGPKSPDRDGCSGRVSCNLPFKLWPDCAGNAYRVEMQGKIAAATLRAEFKIKW